MATAGDRTNFSGDLSLTAPTGGVTRGLIYNIGDIYVVARETASATDSFLAAVQGAVVVSKLTSTGNTLSAGDKVYFDGTSKIQSNSTGGTLIGYALEDAALATTEVAIMLQPLPVTAS